MSETAPASTPQWAGVARSAASAAATGSNPIRSSESDSSCSLRSAPSSRHRISRGSKTCQDSRGWTVTPTRRRDATMPIDSSTRIASRDTDRDTAYSWSTASIVSTWPGARSPATIRAPSASSRLACSPGVGVRRWS